MESDKIHYSREAEQAVIGALLLDDRRFPEVRAVIGPADFFLPEHQLIFKAIDRLVTRGEMIDVVTVAEWMDGEELKKCGGAQYLSHVANVTPSIDNAESYAKIVKRDSIKRAALATVSDLFLELQSDNDPTDLLLQFRDKSAEILGSTAAGTSNLADKFQFSAREALDTEEPDWLIDDVLPAESMTVIYGKSEAYKTFIAMDMVCSIATGASWHGFETKKAPVLYVSAEGQRGINYRKRAWEVKHGRHADWLGILGQPVDMTDPTIGVSLTIAIERFEEQFEVRPALIVLDTLNRCFGDGDENSTQDMTRFIKSCDAVKAATGVGIMIIHHSGKDDTKGMRGNSALRGAVDTEFLVTRPDPDARSTVFKNTKIKDADRPPEITFDMMVQEIGKQDKKGRAITSLVPIKSDKPVYQSGTDMVVDMIQRIISRGHVPSYKLVYDDWKNAQRPGMDENDLRSMFADQVKAAKIGGLIIEENGGFRVL
ncbi:MAG: hypothetical protein Tp138OMZ00d2C19078241_62 [Prokaryotic dsDNA virus sp.]|nr:MAG: hypothetical protein Tp138OMZ00d2C19078241_62 [Prokaryotic dsDNA virus sp.]